MNSAVGGILMVLSGLMQIAITIFACTRPLSVRSLVYGIMLMVYPVAMCVLGLLAVRHRYPVVGMAVSAFYSVTFAVLAILAVSNHFDVWVILYCAAQGVMLGAAGALLFRGRKRLRVEPGQSTY